jgi:osmoprotectant transport system substrate-binding protein
VDRTRRQFLKLSGGAVATAGAGGLAGCTSVLGAAQPGTIKVSSARFAESIILSYLAIESLRANTDLTVLDETALGGTGMNFRAVDNAETTMFWLYTGGGWLTIPPAKERVIPNAQQLYNAVERKMRRRHDLTYLQRAPFNNTYILITTPDWAEQAGVETMTDFAEYVNNGNTDFSVVMGPEFRTRSDGWPGLAKHYGFNEGRSALNVRNVGASLTYQVVANSGAEVGVGYSTNPNIPRYNLMTIADNEQFFPIYNPAPLFNSDAIETNPEVQEPLNAIGPSLSTEKILRLNQFVSIDGRDPQVVAREYLRSEGLI